MKIVRVTWRDAHHDFEQDGDERERDDFLIETLGWLVGRDDRFVSVAQERLPDGRYRGVTHIPIRCIIRGSTLIDEASGTSP